MKKWHGDLRERMQRRGIRQEDVAAVCGYTPEHFSRVLRGRVDAPDDFEGHVGRVLSKMEQAEDAADKARQKVMAS